MSQPVVRRFLSKFRRATDERLGEIDVSHIPLAILQAIFNRTSDDLMYVSYDLEERHARALQQYITADLDLDNFEYFLEAESLRMET